MPQVQNILVTCLLLITFCSSASAQGYSCYKDELHVADILPPDKHGGPQFLILPGDEEHRLELKPKRTKGGLVYYNGDPDETYFILLTPDNQLHVKRKKKGAIAFCVPAIQMQPITPPSQPVAKVEKRINPLTGNVVLGLHPNETRPLAKGAPAALSSTPVTNRPPQEGDLVEVIAPDGTQSRFIQPSQVLPLYTSEDQVRICSRQANGEKGQFLECMVKAMLPTERQQAMECLKQPSATQRGRCLAKQSDLRVARAIVSYENCEKLKGGQQARCLAKENFGQQEMKAFDCATSKTRKEAVAKCLDAIGADKETRRVASAAMDCKEETDGGGVKAMTLCTIRKTGNKELSTAAMCAEEQMETPEFSASRYALCFAGGALGLNDEARIVVDCAAMTGNPYGMAVCAGGMLTGRELKKCFEVGIGGDAGCFGRNNDVIKVLRAVGIDLGDLTNPNGEVVKAWNTITRDAQLGVGPTNDIVQFGNSVTDFVEEHMDNAANDLVHGPGDGNTAKQFVCRLLKC